MKIIQRIWNDIQRGENIDLYLSVAAVLVLGILGLFGIDVSNWLSPVTLAILALLAVSNLMNRDRLTGLSDGAKQLAEAFKQAEKGRTTAASFFHTRPDTPLPAQIRDAKTLDMIGTSLISVAVTNQALVRSLKESGTRIRLLVAYPDDEYLNRIYAARFREVDSPEQHATNVRAALASLETLVGSSISGGSVEVRTTRQDIWFSYIGVNTGTASGRISVELYLTKVSLNENPMFILEAGSDPHWFTVFRDQFEALWKGADTLRAIRG